MPVGAAAVARADTEQQFFQRGDDQQREFAFELALTDQRHGHIFGLGRQAAAADPEDDREQPEDRRKEMRNPVRQAERIDAVAAIEHHVGQIGTAEEHAEHRPRFAAAVERDQLAFDHMILKPAARDEFEHALQRLDRIALGAKIERDEVGLAVGKHRDRRRRAAEMVARINFGQRGLDGAVAAVDHDDARADHRHGANGLFDLIDVLDLIMKDVGVRRAIFANPRQQRAVARGAWIRKERDACHISLKSLYSTGSKDRPLT